MRLFSGNLEMWLWSAGILAGTIVAALICHSLIFAALSRSTRRTGSIFDQSITRHGRRPARVIFPLLAIFLLLPVLRFPDGVMRLIEHVAGLGLIASVAWLIVVCVDVASDLLAAKYRMDLRDNLAARRLRTQIEMLRRIVVAVTSIIALSLMLMTFPSIRHLGDTLLASAGLAGLVVGLAARSTLSNLLAGVQLALTEPIRLGDAVIVEGEYGWVEEIRTTYVVVRIWDLRRLLVPLSYFIEKPFQNWTRNTADLLGTVFVYADYSVPVEEVRRELHRILESTPLWDGKTWGLQVTNAGERTLELRALMSAADSPTSWDLRCYVREKLIEFLQQRYPQSLPRTRAEIESVSPDGQTPVSRFTAGQTAPANRTDRR